MPFTIPYGVYFYGFHSLVWFSIALAVFLWSTYQKSGQNILLRSLCVVLVITFSLIEAGPIVYGKEPYYYDSFSDFCVAQAILLNYCFVSIQAHSACMMINNCLLAMGWKFGRWDMMIDRTIIFLLISYVLPLIPLIMLATRIPDLSHHTMFPFFAHVPARLLISCTTIWYFLFAIPGNIATGILDI